jgi:transcriptional regulator GlxA family with amidase domain
LDVFHFADYWLPRFGRTDEPGYQLVILAASRGPVRTHCGIEIIATQSCYDIKDGLDTLVVAGGEDVEQACRHNPALVEWVRAMAPRVRRVASICTGAFILAAAGLLNHRRATTHWMFSELLATTYPSIQVDSNLIFARDGNIYSSGGITAGIDLALALVEEDRGRESTLSVARTMVVFPGAPEGNRNSVPSDGRSKKTSRTSANFKPGSWATERARSEAARCKLEQAVLPVETIAKQCGFGNAERMRRTFQRLFVISPQDNRARFRSTLLT